MTTNGCTLWLVFVSFNCKMTHCLSERERESKIPNLNDGCGIVIAEVVANFWYRKSRLDIVYKIVLIFWCAPLFTSINLEMKSMNQPTRYLVSFDKSFFFLLILMLEKKFNLFINCVKMEINTFS